MLLIPSADAPRRQPDVVWVEYVENALRPGAQSMTTVDWDLEVTPASLIPADWHGDFVQVVLDGRAVDRDHWECRLPPGTVVTLIRSPGESALRGVLDFYRTILFGPFHAFQNAIKSLAPDLPGRPQLRNESTVYSWSGPFTNWAANGMPIPVVYGDMPRIGGQVISGYTDVKNGLKPTAYVYALILLAAGPVHSIGGVTTDADALTGESLPDGLRINDNLAKHLADITVGVRLGSLTQSPMPGFDQVRTPYSVDLPIDNIASGDPTPVVTDFSMAATWDMPAGETADRLSVVLLAPKGLYLVDDSSGFLLKVGVEFQARYQELDAGGNPVGNAVVTTGTGTFKVGGKNSSAFPYQFEIPLYDPATFTPPTLSSAVQLSSGSKQYGYAGAVALDHVPQWIAGEPVDEVSYCQLVKVNNTKTRNPLWSWANWDQDEADPHVEGVQIVLRQVTSTRSLVRVTLGEGIGASDGVLEFEAGEIVEDTPTHIAFTWKRLAIAGQNRARLYIDGGLVAEQITPVELVSPSGGQLWNTMDGKVSAGTGEWHGALTHDEVQLFDAELTPQQVASLHNDGAWVSASSTVPNLVLGYHLDQLFAGASQPSPSFAPSFDDSQLIFTGSGSASLVTGFALDASANTIKRGRYRLQVQRTTKVHDTSLHQDSFRLDGVSLVLDSNLGYPGCALMGVKARLTDQLDRPQIDVTVPIKGRRDCPVWDGLNADNPTFSYSYSANPFWVLAHHLLDEESGAGHIYDASRIDWPSFKEAADYCDVLVYDQRGKLGGSAASPLVLDYMASGSGLDGAVFVIRLPKPVRSDLIVNKVVRVENLENTTAGSEYPEGDFVIRNVVSVSASEFELWLDWDSDLDAPEEAVTDETGQVLGVEPRLACNIALADRGLQFLEARNLLASIGRASVMSVGDKVQVFQRRPKQPVAVFNAANIVRGSFRMFSARPFGGRFNRSTAEIQDQDQDGSKNTVTVDHSSLTDASSSAVLRAKTFDMRGVTNASQARRELALSVNANYSVRVGVEFDAAAEGFFAAPGDVFVLAHPLPSWAYGGRLERASDDEDGIYPDVAVLLGTRNMLARTNDLGNAAWTRSADAGAAPSVNGTAAADPDGVNVADEVTFPSASTNPWIGQAYFNRGSGFVSTSAWWVRLVSGEANKLVHEVVGASGVVASATPTLTSTWTRYALASTSSRGVATDPTLTSRWRLDGSAAGDVTVQFCRQIAFAGADDGLDAIGEEVVVDHTAHYVAVVNHEQDDAVSFAQTSASAGAYEAGELVPLAESLAWTPGERWRWVLGPMTFGSYRFEISSAVAQGDFVTRIQGVEYRDDIWPDEDAFDQLAGFQDPETSEAAVFSPSTLPLPMTSLAVTEEASRDGITGAIESSLLASWALDRSTAHHVAKVRVWVRESGDLDYDQVAEVAGAQTSVRLSGLQLRAAETYTVAVQPVTRSGLALPLERCRRARHTVRAIFPQPAAPTGMRAVLSGEQAIYEVDLPTAMQDAAVELYRGGTFCGQLVGRIPVGSEVLGPTYDWCRVPANNEGRGSPPIYARLVLPNGSRGRFYRHDDEIEARTFPAALLEKSLEDEPWAVTGAALSELATYASPIPGRADGLKFDGASSELVGTYTTPAYDLGRARRVHISAGLVAQQVPPTDEADTREDLDALSMRTYTPQGHLDPGHPRYGRVITSLEWAYSETGADPGSTYTPLRCGVATVRSFRIRVKFTRPAATWDVRLERLTFAVRPMPRLAVADFEVDS